MTDSPEARLAALGLELPAVPAPLAAYVPAVRNALAAVASVAGGLSAVTQVVKMTGFVASTPDFTGQPQVVNGASELLLEVFGEAGRHARSAVAAPVLPFDAPVEIELIVEVSASPYPAAPHSASLDPAAPPND
jgi:enamine deaminase RidA (YjgF/YER057c/UK114 family)